MSRHKCCTQNLALCLLTPTQDSAGWYAASTKDGVPHCRERCNAIRYPTTPCTRPDKTDFCFGPRRFIGNKVATGGTFVNSPPPRHPPKHGCCNRLYENNVGTKNIKKGRLSFWAPVSMVYPPLALDTRSHGSCKR